MIASLKKKRIVLFIPFPGPFYTPLLSGAHSRNTELRKALGMELTILNV